MSVEDIDAMILKIRRLPELVREAAPSVGVAFDGALKTAVSSGRMPGGPAWKPKAKGGGRPLAGAAAAITTSVSGTAVTSEVSDWIHRFHHNGTKKLPARPMLPRLLEDFPAGMEAIKGALIDKFNEVMK